MIEKQDGLHNKLTEAFFCFFWKAMTTNLQYFTDIFCTLMTAFKHPKDDFKSIK